MQRPAELNDIVPNAIVNIAEVRQRCSVTNIDIQDTLALIVDSLRPRVKKTGRLCSASRTQGRKDEPSLLRQSRLNRGGAQEKEYRQPSSHFVLPDRSFFEQAQSKSSHARDRPDILPNVRLPDRQRILRSAEG
jgi:hypothetical protein